MPGPDATTVRYRKAGGVDRAELVAEVNGYAVPIEWPTELFSQQAEVLAGHRVVAESNGTPIHYDFHEDFRAFGHDAYHYLIEPVRPLLGESSRWYVSVDTECAHLPFEAAVAPPLTKPLAITTDAPTLLRTAGRLLDGPLWQDAPLSVVQLDSVGAYGTADARWQMVEESIRALGGTPHRFPIREPGDFHDALAGATASIIDLHAHGVNGGTTVRCGPSDDSGPTVAAAELVELIAKAQPSVVILRMCNSSSVTSGWSSFAEQLVEAGVPAVIAARMRVYSTAMAEFTYGFYSSIVAGLSFDDCIRAGRLHMAAASHVIHQAVLTVHVGTTDNSPYPRADLGALQRLEHSVRELRLDLLDEFRATQSELRRDLAQIHERSMEERHRALPYVRRSATEPRRLSDLLAPENLVVPLVGRDRQLEELTRWRDGDNHISIASIVGEGGWGKTRLALEFVNLSATIGWHARVVAPKALAAGLDAVLSDDHDLLLMIDYAHTTPESVCELARRWLESPGSRRRLRLLLVLRVRPLRGGWMSDFTAATTAYANELKHVFEPRTDEHADGALLLDLSAGGDIDDASFAALTARSFARHWPATTPRHGSPDDFRPNGTSPLQISFAAMQHLADGAATLGPIEWLIRHEQGSWAPAPTGLDDEWCTKAMVAAVLCQPETERELADILAACFTGERVPARTLASWVRRSLGGRLDWQPDRVAETYVAHALRYHDELVDEIWDRAPHYRAAAVSVLERIRRHERLTPTAMKRLAPSPSLGLESATISTQPIDREQQYAS